MKIISFEYFPFTWQRYRDFIILKDYDNQPVVSYWVIIDGEPTGGSTLQSVKAYIDDWYLDRAYIELDNWNHKLK